MIRKEAEAFEVVWEKFAFKNATVEKSMAKFAIDRLEIQFEGQQYDVLDGHRDVKARLGGPNFIRPSNSAHLQTS